MMIQHDVFDAGTAAHVAFGGASSRRVFHAVA